MNDNFKDSNSKEMTFEQINQQQRSSANKINESTNESSDLEKINSLIFLNNLIFANQFQTPINLTDSNIAVSPEDSSNINNLASLHNLLNNIANMNITQNIPQNILNMPNLPQDMHHNMSQNIHPNMTHNISNLTNFQSTNWVQNNVSESNIQQNMNI